MIDIGIFEPLGVALGLGLLVGLQRQRGRHRLGGIRTFPLITLLGSVCALLTQSLGQGAIVAGFLALAAMLVIGNLVAVRGERAAGPGVTTEVAALLMFTVGAALMSGYMAAAIVVAAVAAVLLQWKQPLHQFVSSIDEGDLRGIFQFVLVALVILPILPDEQMGPFDALNPFRIWLIVAVIIGISLAAYFAHRAVGSAAGTLLGGMLGGLVSSTATSISYARQSKTGVGSGGPAIVIVLASAVVYIRIAIELAVLAPSLLGTAVIPLGAMFLFVFGAGLFLYWRTPVSEPASLSLENPAQAKTALLFGGLYSLILLAVAALEDWAGGGAIYLVSVLSGLTDVDALTLSAADLFARGELAAPTAWRAVVLASISNLLFKLGAVAMLGARLAVIPVLIVFVLAATLGLALMLVLPF